MLLGRANGLKTGLRRNFVGCCMVERVSYIPSRREGALRIARPRERREGVAGVFRVARGGDRKQASMVVTGEDGALEVEVVEMLLAGMDGGGSLAAGGRRQTDRGAGMRATLVKPVPFLEARRYADGASARRPVSSRAGGKQSVPHPPAAARPARKDSGDLHRLLPAPSAAGGGRRQVARPAGFLRG
jgi:hypothetical protein